MIKSKLFLVLYNLRCNGAAFQIQAANMRAAANHVIQCSGAIITKDLQRRLWDLQPSGVRRGYQPMNVHDESCAHAARGYELKVREVVDNFIRETNRQVRRWRLVLTGTILMNGWAEK